MSRSRSLNIARTALAGLALSSLSHFACAGTQSCEEWAHFIGGGITEGDPFEVIKSAIVYNGDLVVSGRFLEIGGTPANRIARWDGTQWHPLANGIDAEGANAMVVYNGDLIVGGSFNTVDGGLAAKGIARWDGSQWHAIGQLSSGFIREMTVWDGNLVVAGYFPQVSGVPVNHIARWDGTQWHGFNGGSQANQVNAVIEYNGDLIAGGYFDVMGGVTASRVARWDGTQWHRIAGGVTGGIVDALEVYQGDLIISGTFRYAGGIWSNRVTRWDGTQYHPLGAGVTDDPEGVWGQARALVVHDGDLYMGGTFYSVDHMDVYHVARWDGTTWHSMGPGVRHNVWDYVVYNNMVIAVGDFYSAGEISVDKIATWLPCSHAQCPGDIVNDGQVNLFDLLDLLSAWGACNDCPQDLNDSGAVDLFDLLDLLAAWGACPLR